MKDTPDKKKPTPADFEAELAANTEGPPLPPALETLARILAAGTDEETQKLLGVEGASPLQAFQDWGRENTRLRRDALTDALRRVLADILARNVEKLAAVVDVLRPWTEQDANIEALAEWLGKGGWDKVDGDKVEAALVTAARAVPTPDGVKKLNMACSCWPRLDGPYFVFLYDVHRAELEAADVQKRIAALAGSSLDELENLMLPKGTPPPDKKTVLLGLDALKAGLQYFDWGGLALCATGPDWKPMDPPPAWLRLLAGPWLEERAERETERLQREHKARKLAVLTVRTGAGEHARLPKHAAGISWAFGGAGVKLPEGYKAAPNMAALVPPGYALLRDADLARPYQAALPLLVEGDDSPPLVLAVTGASRDVFTPAAAALAVYVMAATWDKPEVLQETTLRDLARAIYPNTPRLQPIHFKAVADALNMMRTARILWPNGYADALFYVPRWTWKTPDAEALNTPLIVGIDQHFLTRTLPDITAATGIKSLRGQFIFNLTGAMQLDKDRPGLLRQYLRAVATGDACYDFKTGKPAPDRVPDVDAVRWAILTNYLPRKSGLQGKDPRPVGRVAKSKALKRMLADIAELADRGLVKVARADHKTIKLQLTAADLEAWEAFHAGKHRQQ